MPTIVVVDEAARVLSLYGRVFEAMSIHPVIGLGRTPDEIIALRPDAILLTSEWTHDVRLIAAAARAANIPVIYVIDGALEWSHLWNNVTFIRPHGTNLQPLISSDLCVFGQHQARILSSMGLGDRIHIVGLPRLDTVSRERIVCAGQRPRIVIATSRQAGHDVEHQLSNLSALRDLKTWFAGQADVDPVWRIPADLAEEIGVAPDIDGSISDVLARSDALISFTSTCILEGMHKGIPVAQIEYRPVPTYVETAWQIRCANHIASVIHELLYPSGPKLAWQDACFADELEAGNATDRLVQVIREVIAREIHYAEAKQPRRVAGRLDFRQIYSELSTFAISDSAVLQYELSAARTALRQAKQEKAAIQRDCLELVEACWGENVETLRAYSFIERFADSKAVIHEEPGHATTAQCTLNGHTSRVLLLHPPAEARYTIPTGCSGRLLFAISMHPDVWDNPESGACRFVVQANGTILFDATIDQASDPADRRWWWFETLIPESTTGFHQVTLSTQGIGNNAYRWALWRSPLFLWNEESAKPGSLDAFRLKAAAGFDYYVPGRTLV